MLISFVRRKKVIGVSVAHIPEAVIVTRAKKTKIDMTIYSATIFVTFLKKADKHGLLHEKKSKK